MYLAHRIFFDNMGMSDWSPSDILKAVHVSIASCRNSSQALLDIVPRFVSKYVVADTDDNYSADGRRGFWTAFGVPLYVLEVVLEVDPRWDFDTNVLFVRPAVTLDEGGVAKTRSIISYFPPLRTFSETRMGGVGTVARLLVASPSVGLSALVKLVQATLEINNFQYHIGGLLFCTTAVKHYVCIASFSVYPPESFILSLLKDDRFLLHSASIWEGVEDEVAYVVGVPQSLWDSAAPIVGDTRTTGLSLRHDVISSMATALSYLQHHGDAPLSSYPLSLTQGDIDDNLQRLFAVALGDLTDYTTEHIHFCVSFEPWGTKQSLLLWRDIVCFVGLVEKGHVAGAVTKSFHNNLGPEMLRVRAFLVQCRPLFRKSREALRIEGLRAEWERLLEHSSVSRFSARNLFVSTMIASVAASCGVSGSNRREASQHCITNQSVLFQGLSSEDKLFLEVEAARERTRRQTANTIDAAHIHAQMRLAQSRLAAEWLRGGMPNLQGG